MIRRKKRMKSDKQEIRKKYSELKEHLASLGSLVVGFSGGVDSAFLLAVAHEALGDSVVAVTARSPLVPAADLDEATAFCRERGIRHFTVDFDPLADETVRSNPADRCYHCKKIVFGGITDKARELGIQYVADGSNADDVSDYRPGERAVKELGIISPLREAGLTKSEIRELSKEMGLPTWEKPSAACLASRFAYGEKITEEGLVRVARAEKIIKDMGFEGIRVRVHGNLARIEADPADIELIAYGHTRKEISEELKRLGFKYVTIDIDGYRVGSMNEVL